MAQPSGHCARPRRVQDCRCHPNEHAAAERTPAQRGGTAQKKGGRAALHHPNPNCAPSMMQHKQKHLNITLRSENPNSSLPTHVVRGDTQSRILPKANSAARVANAPTPRLAHNPTWKKDPTQRLTLRALLRHSAMALRASKPTTIKSSNNAQIKGAPHYQNHKTLLRQLLRVPIPLLRPEIAA